MNCHRQFKNDGLPGELGVETALQRQSRIGEGDQASK